MLKPLHDRILVKRADAKETTASGLFIPERARETPLFAEVLGIGSAVKEIKKGDTILLARYSGTEVKVDGQEMLMLREGDVIGVVEA